MTFPLIVLGYDSRRVLTTTGPDGQRIVAVFTDGELASLHRDYYNRHLAEHTLRLSVTGGGEAARVSPMVLPTAGAARDLVLAMGGLGEDCYVTLDPPAPGSTAPVECWDLSEFVSKL